MVYVPGQPQQVYMQSPVMQPQVQQFASQEGLMYMPVSNGGQQQVVLAAQQQPVVIPQAPVVQESIVQQQVVEMPERPQVKHMPLAKCRCLYLGCAVPLETAVGLEAIQQPLGERYKTYVKEMQGIDCWLTVYSSGIQLKFAEDTSAVHWFPISTLHVCAAVKAVDLVMESGARNTNFVALDSHHGKNSSNPPIFSAILRRIKGRKVLECHSFIAKSDPAAMALVQSATHAYTHKEGWIDEAPSAELSQSEDPMRLLAADPLPKNAPQEYYKPSPASGYFYTTKKDLVKNYAVNNTQVPVAAPQMTMMGGPEQMTMMGGPEQMTMMGGPEQMTMMGGPEQMTMIGGPEQMALMPSQPQHGPMPYFNDWNAFPGQPVAIFDQPGAVYGGEKKKKKKKKKKKSKSHKHCNDEYCCCPTDECGHDIYNKREYYPDPYYRDYNRHRPDHGQRAPSRFPPPQPDYHIQREPDARRPDARGGHVFLEEPYCDDPYYRDPYAQPRFYDSPRAPVIEDDFQFYAPGYAYAPGYDGQDPYNYGYDNGCGYPEDYRGYDDYGDQFYDPYAGARDPYYRGGKDPLADAFHHRARIY